MKPGIIQIRISNFFFFTFLALMIAYFFSISKPAIANTSNIQTTANQEDISLTDAIAKKIVSAKFCGTGAAFGDAITVEVKNKTKFPLTIKVTPGTKLISNDPSKQNMVLGKVKGKLVDGKNYMVNDFIEIQPKTKGKYILEAYCIESPKPEPTPSTSFKIGELDSTIQFIIQKGNNQGFSLYTIQAAIWIYLENKTDEQLKERIEVNEEDLLKAKELIELLKRSRQ